MTRPLVGLSAIALVAAILTLDLARAGAPDLFAAPPTLALGSGQAPSGAHCTAN